MIQLISLRKTNVYFSNEVIIIPNNNIKKWLQKKINAKNNIKGNNIEFYSLTNFLWKIFFYILPNMPKKNIFSKYKITWQLMQIIPKLINEPEFASIKKFLSENNYKRYFEFSVIMSKIFKKYMILRPDWLNKWIKNETIDLINEIQTWQLLLWQSLVKKNLDNYKSLQNYINFYLDFPKFLNQNNKVLHILPKKIFIFGFSKFYPIYLEILKSLSNYTHVYLLVMNPCKHYYGDFFYSNTLLSFMNNEKQEVKNNLLKNWGKQNIDNINLLLQIENNIEKKFFNEPLNNCLLNKIKINILLLQNNSFFKKKKCNTEHILNYHDDSLSFHICCSLQQEIEVLYENLLLIMNRNKNILPNDIIIMAPDINIYVPYIKTIFDFKCKKKIPYSIIDIKIPYFNCITSAFLILLKLYKKKFSIKEILILIEVPSIALRFGFEKNVIEILQSYILKFNINWKLIDDLKNKYISLNKKNFYSSLIIKLKKYLYLNQKYNEEKILIDNKLKKKIIYVLSNLINKLHFWYEILIHPYSLITWINHINDIINEFFIIDNSTKKTLFFLMKQWNNILKYGIKIKFNKLIHINVLYEEFIKQIERKKTNLKFSLKKINFCTLNEKNIIPCKIIYLLGMNDKNYPRNFNVKNINLIKFTNRLGDFSKKNEEYYLLLKILLCAQYKIYISFIEKDIYSNKFYYPSVLIQELMDYVIKNINFKKKNKINIENINLYLYKKHHYPYTIKKNIFVNKIYDNTIENIIKLKKQSTSNFIKPLKFIDFKNINVNKFINFYKNPVRTWFQQRLSIFLFNSFNSKIICNKLCNNLVKYKIKNQILNSLIYNTNIYYINHKKYNYNTLCEMFDRINIEKYYQSMSSIVKKINLFKKKDISNFEINLKLNKSLIFGFLINTQINGILRWKTQPISVRDNLILWIEHLLYCASGGRGESRIIGLNSECYFKTLTKEDAKYFLMLLISGYCKGMTSPLLLSKSGEIWIKYSYDVETKNINYQSEFQKKAEMKLIKNFEGNEYFIGEKKDLYLRKLIPNLEEKYIKEIIDVARCYFLTPLKFNQSLNK